MPEQAQSAAAKDTADAPPVRPVRQPSRWRRVLAAIVIFYTIAIFALLAWMYLQGDRAWLATLFLFGPRWVCALPLAVLVPWAAIMHRRMLLPLALAALVTLGPILGFRPHVAGARGPVALRVMTFNANGFRFPMSDFIDFVDREQPDVIALQEMTGSPRNMPWPEGWHAIRRDEYTVLSRYPLELAGVFRRPTQPNKCAAIRYRIELPGGTIQLFNLHLPSPRFGLVAVLGDDEAFDWGGVSDVDHVGRMRAAESEAVSRWIAKFPGAKIVVGDFNLPTESTIYRASWSPFENAFSRAGLGFGYTKRTPLLGTTYGTRIDHILYTPPWQCVRAWLGPDIGSDHLPLLADFR